MTLILQPTVNSPRRHAPGIVPRRAAGGAGILNRIKPEPDGIGSGNTQKPARAVALGWIDDSFVNDVSATHAAQRDDFRGKVSDVDLQRFFDLG